MAWGGNSAGRGGPRVRHGPARVGGVVVAQYSPLYSYSLLSSFSLNDPIICVAPRSVSKLSMNILRMPANGLFSSFYFSDFVTVEVRNMRRASFCCFANCCLVGCTVEFCRGIGFGQNNKILFELT